MGLRPYLKRIMPERRHIQGHKHLQIFGDILHDPNVFHLTRRSAAGAAAVGLFLAFMPVPGQMVLAALAAILFRINLPLSVVFVWISNPITIPPMFFLAYKTGSFLLNEPARNIQFELSFGWLSEIFSEIWQPLLLGCFSLGTLSAIVGYISIRLLWRLAIISKWEERKKKSQQAD